MLNIGDGDCIEVLIIYFVQPRHKYNKWSLPKHAETRTNWPLFYTQRFQMHFEMNIDMSN